MQQKKLNDVKKKRVLISVKNRIKFFLVFKASEN